MSINQSLMTSHRCQVPVSSVCRSLSCWSFNKRLFLVVLMGLHFNITNVETRIFLILIPPPMNDTSILSTLPAEPDTLSAACPSVFAHVRLLFTG